MNLERVYLRSMVIQVRRGNNVTTRPPRPRGGRVRCRAAGCGGWTALAGVLPPVPQPPPRWGVARPRPRPPRGRVVRVVTAVVGVYSCSRWYLHL